MIIKRVKGDNYSLDIQITNEDDEAIDLTDCTVFFTVKRNIQDTDAEALISVDITSHTSPTTGETSIPLTSTQTDIVGEFFYDVKIKTLGGTITSVIKDKIIFIENVTIRTS
jgi:hypothetical protein